VVWAAAVALLGVGLWALVHARSAGRAAAPRAAVPIPVSTAVAESGSINVYLTGLGSVTPLATITVKTRIDGELMSVFYHEGDTIREGAPLVEIDPRPYEVQLQQAQGQLAKDQAALDNSRIDLQRYEALIAKNAVAQQILVTQRSTVQQNEGVVKTDQAAVANAKLNLVYTRPTAPITGKVGLRLVDPGNFVSAAAGTPLAVITEMQPMSVIFTLPEGQVPAVIARRRTKAGLRVDAMDRDMSKTLATGTLTTLDNQIDPTTGTLKLRATFDNKDGALIPNQFVNARLLLETKTNATLVPNAAVQRNGTATFVYVIRPNSTVSVRRVTVGTIDAHRSQITSGLAPGEHVVTQGVDKLTEGAAVESQTPDGVAVP
jgi:multidrug efflux system membrane fusion protein